MRKVICLSVVLSLFGLLTTVLAQVDPAKAKEEALQKLNFTEWEVTLTPSFSFDKQRSPLEKDVLEFGRNNVTSKNLEALGFPRSNYSLRVQSSGSVIWETMKTREDGVIVFLRGEVTPDFTGMGGTITIPVQTEKNISEAKPFSFSSISKKALEISEEELKAVQDERAREEQRKAELKKIEEEKKAAEEKAKKEKKEEEKPKKKHWWQR